jgi:hypothetical protein
MHPAYINKVTDAMMQAAQTPGQGVTPGNSGANTGGAGKVGPMTERYKDNNFARDLY